MPVRTVVTIGNFDGVHAGHAALVRRARERAGPDGRVVAMVFDPHPLSALRPGAAPARLSTFAQRENWLRSLGADEVERLTPTKELLALTAEQFVEKLSRERRPSAVVEGPDFRFGAGRGGDVRALAELGDKFGFGVDIVDAVEVTLNDQTIVTASSTMTRWLVGEGRVRDAAVVLGRPYEIVGEVERGDRRGRTIGCPTANVRTEQLLPADGVYAGLATLPDGRTFAAAVSVGDKPTFAAGERALEAHLLDWEGPAGRMEEYGWPLSISVLAWLRDQIRYVSAEPLVEQIARDIERTRRIAAESSPEIIVRRPGRGAVA